jgi:hypothetical protein
MSAYLGSLNEYTYERDENQVENAIKDERNGTKPFPRGLNVEC